MSWDDTGGEDDYDLDDYEFDPIEQMELEGEEWLYVY